MQDSDENISDPVISDEDLVSKNLISRLVIPGLFIILRIIKECIQQHDQLYGNNKDDSQNIDEEKMKILRRKENSVAALRVTEIKTKKSQTTPVVNVVRLLVPTIMSYFTKSMRNSRKTSLNFTSIICRPPIETHMLC